MRRQTAIDLQDSMHGIGGLDTWGDWRERATLPRSLRSVADVPEARTEEKIAHSGRDDRKSEAEAGSGKAESTEAGSSPQVHKAAPGVRHTRANDCYC